MNKMPSTASMNDHEVSILEMHHDGMDAQSIADELLLPVATVKEVIKAWENGEYKTR